MHASPGQGDNVGMLKKLLLLGSLNLSGGLNLKHSFANTLPRVRGVLGGEGGGGQNSCRNGTLEYTHPPQLKTPHGQKGEGGFKRLSG